jgi:hypothetical protein
MREGNPLKRLRHSLRNPVMNVGPAAAGTSTKKRSLGAQDRDLMHIDIFLVTAESTQITYANGARRHGFKRSVAAAAAGHVVR